MAFVSLRRSGELGALGTIPPHHCNAPTSFEGAHRCVVIAVLLFAVIPFAAYWSLSGSVFARDALTNARGFLKSSTRGKEGYLILSPQRMPGYSAMI